MRNQGNAAAAGSTTRYYLSRDALKGSGDVLLGGTRSVPLLAESAQSTGSVTVTLPASASGAYFLLACADDLKKVAENNETNNSCASATQIAVGP